AVRARLAGHKVSFAANPDYALGLSSSLRAGLAALPADADGVLVCLGDMPGVDAPLLDRLIAAFNPTEGREIVVPVRDGRRGNPVLWGRRFLPALRTLTGDAGAKHLIGDHGEYVVEVDSPDDAPLTDIDTPAELAAWRGR
ncbi:MAG TPA: nucleotidyltransferase family protein, partial [Stellaceae bacterium]|nr:nucleotidyltransferase family protein [Stellaceae bacterium]